VGFSIKVKFGLVYVDVEVEKSCLHRILIPSYYSPLADALFEFKQKIEPLKSTMRNRNIRTLAVIVEDKTRNNPEYPQFLAELNKLIDQNGRIKKYLVIAYGTHSKHTTAENERAYGYRNLRDMETIDHDCNDNALLRDVGKLSTGSRLSVNKYVAEADFIVTLSSVSPHVFAGYTGGRKIILPGVASYANIRENHSKVILENVGVGILSKNPIHEEMTEAAHLLNVDYSIQLVRNNSGELAGIFADDIDTAFNAACELCNEINSVTINQYSDVTYVSCGGYPSDANLYSAQRAITTAASITRPGGIVVVFGEFPQGMGNEVYERSLHKSLPDLLNLQQNEIDIGVHSAFLTAKNFSRCTIILYTNNAGTSSEFINVHSMYDLQRIKQFINDRCGLEHMAYFIPNGSNIICKLKEGSKRSVKRGK